MDKKDLRNKLLQYVYIYKDKQINIKWKKSLK